MLDVFCGVSFSAMSKIQRNSPTTTKYWFKKASLAVKSYVNSIILTGEVYLDVMFVSVEKGVIALTETGKKKRGVSKNQIAVVVATDKTYILAFEVGKGKTSAEQIASTLYEKIEEGSHVYCDDDNSFTQLIEEQRLIPHVFNSAYLKTLNDDLNPIQPVNDAIFLIRYFLNQHKGFKREELQDYLNIFSASNIKGINKLLVAENICEIILSPNFKGANVLRYRDYYKKKDKKQD